ncbi:MAG: YwdI family protein [Solibacillus sp.]
MISYEVIVAQIEKHLVQAKQNQSEAVLREQLTAIHALCEVALQTGDKQITRPVQTVSASPSVMTSATKLEEQDANGESLFDF